MNHAHRSALGVLSSELQHQGQREGTIEVKNLGAFLRKPGFQDADEGCSIAFVCCFPRFKWLVGGGNRQHGLPVGDFLFG